MVLANNLLPCYFYPINLYFKQIYADVLSKRRSKNSKQRLATTKETILYLYPYLNGFSKQKFCVFESLVVDVNYNT